jgi:hypothetical protein
LVNGPVAMLGGLMGYRECSYNVLKLIDRRGNRTLIMQ